MKLLRLALPVILFFLTVQAVLAQSSGTDVAASLVKKFEYYAAKKRQGVLFAHFDKNIYTSNENIWFTAYLINDKSATNDILSVIMVNDDDHSIALKDKFKMAGGISSGRMFLPDTVPAGNYSFMLYTNKMLNGQPENVFIQQVTVKSATPSSFIASLVLQDDAATADTKKVLLNVSTAGSDLVAGANVEYYLGDKLQPALSGTGKTDAAGQLALNIPANTIVAGSNILYAKISYNNDVKLVKLALPAQKNAMVKFYPEGGNLSDGIVSTVGWEVKSPDGGPMAAKGFLYKDGKQIDTVYTNEYGMGSFILAPIAGGKYYVKLSGVSGADSVYNLPEIQANSPIVTIAKAVTEGTLSIMVKSKIPEKFYVLVHNYEQTFASIPVQADSKGKALDISLANVPKGLAEITILDSLQQPYAERLFFAHYDQRDPVQLTTGAVDYKTRQKVNLKLNLTSATGKPLTGDVSIACVQANRLDPKKMTDIESYFYLNSQLGTLPTNQTYFNGSTANKKLLEDILLIKGWRRYSWMELAQVTVKDTARAEQPLIFNGVVTDLGKKLKKAVSVTLTRDSSRKAFTSNANGTFTLADSDLYVTENEKVHLYVNTTEKVEYFFTVNDPYVKTNLALANAYKPTGFIPVLANSQRESQESLKGFEHAIQLKEVNIKGGVDTLMNACGDYYCINGILNCPNHHHDSQNQIPLKGHTYYIFNPLTTIKKPFVYKGCNPDEADAAKGFNAVHYAMEFYPADYAKENPSTSDYISTIYWNKRYHVSFGKEADFSFYTSDITGGFKIIVQGVTDNGVVYVEKAFTVNKN